ncbi:MAG: dodecin domain-containing protein [Actinobacteria bacterium]|nr:MAG: dodecin domain-containing protein [Actinomycetota bacterium]
MVEKTIQLTGTSPNGVQEAIELAIARAGVTIRGLRRAAVRELRMEPAENRITHWVVDLDVTFEIREELHG